jgi:hypothetical protein
MVSPDSMPQSYPIANQFVICFYLPKEFWQLYQPVVTIFSASYPPPVVNPLDQAVGASLGN